MAKCFALWLIGHPMQAGSFCRAVLGVYVIILLAAMLLYFFDR